MITNIDNDMHDGSRLGNGHVNAEAYVNLEVCPDKKCSSLGCHWKCYWDMFKQCKTYLKRNDIEVLEFDSELGERNIYGGRETREDYKGYAVINGVYKIVNSELGGKLVSNFVQRD